MRHFSANVAQLPRYGHDCAASLHLSIPVYSYGPRYSGPRHAEVISDRQAAALILLIVAGGCQYCPQCPALSSVEVEK